MCPYFDIRQGGGLDSPFGQFFPGGQFTPGGPFGPGGPFTPGTPPPFGGAGAQGAPTSPPPPFTPQQPTTQFGGPSVYAVDPGAIRPCTFRYIYIWLENGQSFWAWLTFVGPRSVAGFRWTRFGWRYFGTDINNIDNFVCY